MSEFKSLLKVPNRFHLTIEAHKKWIEILNEAQIIVENDAELQDAASNGRRLEGRAIPPMILGRCYAQYCNLINKMYDSYLNNVQLQRAPYILNIVAVFVKRMYELRNELVHVIGNDYIYVDAALTQLRMTPFDIQIVLPYHFPTESRPEDIEQLLQRMWAEAIRRKRPKKLKPKFPTPARTISLQNNKIFPSKEQIEEFSEESEEESPPPSIHTAVPEDYIQAVLIQKHEKFREYMSIKRQRVRDTERDILLGLLPEAGRSGKLDYREENRKVYERRRNTRLKIKHTYLQELEKENTRLIIFKKENQIEDITDQIREWFMEWYYGYGFFPEFPYETEGGTMLVIRGQYPTIKEKAEEDERLETTMKGKTKEMIKQEKARAKADAKLTAEIERKKRKKDAEALFKARCNPFTDPGYEIQISSLMENLITALQEYRTAWSIYDEFPLQQYGEVIYGYMRNLLTEDLMCQMHKDCRMYVDGLMRLDLKFLIGAHQAMYKRLEMKYPKFKPRKKPKVPSVPKTLVLDANLLKNLEQIFDLGIITKSTAKLDDVFGDMKYAAYEYNIRDPDASFPPPGYGDVKRRIMLSCILACGIQPGAPKNRAVMLLGPEKSGKSYLVDVIAGELNAVKIDITPEVFSAVLEKPVKVLSQVFLAAKALQPSVVYMRNVERVFSKKVPPEEKYLQATTIKQALVKLVKQISNNDKVIFIATCSNPFVAQEHQMVTLFDEIILVPRMDYGSLQKFFYEKLQSEISSPRDFPIQPLAQLCQGYGSGAVIEAYNDVMTPERICNMNIKPLSPGEFLDALLDKGSLLTLEEYQEYVNFYVRNSPIKTERQEYAIINTYREDAYKKQAKKMKADLKTKFTRT